MNCSESVKSIDEEGIPFMTLEFPKSGRVGTLISTSIKNDFIQFCSHTESHQNLMVITRLSPRRLIRHVDLAGVEFRWLSMQESPHSITPSLEHTNHLINSTISNQNGLIWIDGLEYLSDRQGFDAVHSFVRNVVDSINNTEWSVIIAIEDGTFDKMQIAQITREAESIFFDFSEDADIEIELMSKSEEKSTPEEINVLPKNDSLKHLSKITEEGFTHKTLRERIIQWKNMGLDVSILEPALAYQNLEEAFKLYSEVDELIRIAVELDLRIDLLKDSGEAAKAYAYKYRIRQLTGLDEISRILDTLL
ncbi:MAG: hypothetical protein CMB56_007525 [Methanobacteriota archaeon]|nr:MAG: hypothetical protein CMB56_007525 [Euryarchaeota archaeon]|tara:strand:+ start:438 stop:1358 length:921 start_codon:yes stop_codon:yes gene_type:complete